MCCVTMLGCGRHHTPYRAGVREANGVVISVAAWGPDSARLDHAVAAALDSAAAALAMLKDAVSPEFERLALRANALARASGGAYGPTGDRHTDLGELGRGFVLDRALAVLHGAADSAVISSGGQYLIHSDWSGARVIGIVDPDNTLETLARLIVPPGTWAVSLRSVAEARDELRDPRTGKPATRTRVVAAMAPSAADAGGWSMAFYVVGCDSALVLAPRVHASVICADGDVRWTSDLDGRVTRDSMRER